MFKLTATGDLSRTDGRFDTLDESTDVDACVAQRLAVRLRRQLGEWPWDTRLGLDISRMMAKGTPRAVQLALVRRTIAGTVGVETIRALDITTDPSTRVGTITGTVARTGGALVDFNVSSEG